jgi:hypothetical protein
MMYAQIRLELLRGKKIFAWLNGVATTTMQFKYDTTDDMTITCLPHSNLSMWKNLLYPMFGIWVQEPMC